MANKLRVLYPASADTIGDRYMQWVALRGPDWATIGTYVKAQTGLTDFRAAWNAYWAS